MILKNNQYNINDAKEYVKYAFNDPEFADMLIAHMEK